MSGKSNTYHIGSIGSFAGNMGGQVDGNVNGTATLNMEQELEKVAALVGQLRQYQGQMGLAPQQQAEIGRHADAVEKELQDSKPRLGAIAGLLKSIKSMTEGAAGNLIASGVVSAISNIKL